MRVPLQRLQEETTSQEFLEWIAFLDLHETKGFHREDHLFARLTAEVARGHVKNPNQVRVDDYLPRFTRPEPVDPVKKMEQSKAFWFSALGKKEKVPRGK